MKEKQMVDKELEERRAVKEDSGLEHNGTPQQ